MTHISGEYSFSRIERMFDVTGISGSGTVAYLVDLRNDGQLMLWDTHFGANRDIPSHGIEVLPNQTLVEMIHGHDGNTVISPLNHPAHQQRLEHLLGVAAPRLLRIAGRLDPVPLGTPWNGQFFRVGRSNPRNLYLTTGSEDWKNDIPVGSSYTKRMGALTAHALNELCAHNPGLIDRYRSELIPPDQSAATPDGYAATDERATPPRTSTTAADAQWETE